MILKYQDFLLENSQDFTFYLSHRICDILSIIQRDTKNPKIRDIIESILGLSNNSRDSITYVDVTDKNDMVSFFDLNKLFQVYYTKMNMTGDRNFQKVSNEVFIDFTEWLPSVYDSDFTDTKSWIWTDNKRTSINVGRLFVRILTKNKISYDPTNIEEIVNLYKSTYDFINGEKEFTLVKGEDIRKWYHESRYLMKKGDLSNSCMRYEKCQKFLDIFVENPEKINLLILRNMDHPDKIMGRSLIWKLDDGNFYMDRVYTNIPSDVDLFKKYAQENGYPVSYYEHGSVRVKLDKWDFKYFPYMDTFAYLDTNSGFIYNDSYDDDLWELRSTTGGWEDNSGRQWSDRYGEYIDAEDACFCVDIADYLHYEDCHWLEYRGEYYSRDSNVAYSEFHGDNILEGDYVYSEYLDDYLFNDEVESVFIDINNDDPDYIPKSNHIDIKVVTDEISGKKTLAILCYQIDGKYYHKDSDLSLIPEGHEILTQDEYLSNLFDRIKEYYKKYGSLLYNTTMFYPFHGNGDFLTLIVYLFADPSKFNSKTYDELFSNRELIKKIVKFNEVNNIETSFFKDELNLDVFKDGYHAMTLNRLKSYEMELNTLFLRSPAMFNFYRKLKGN